MTEPWTRWEGHVINGVFPLRRFVNASECTAVFLTESRVEAFPNAAIKLVASDAASAELQLAQWRMTAALSHPRLIRLLDAGRCELDGQPFLFVVMEYAEETLSEILPFRALSSAEVRDMLLPALDALAFLHERNLVHGQVKPANFMVVQDQVKLASDTVRPAGDSAALAHSAAYEPPEARTIGFFPAADIWGLGISLVEALTQYPPWWPEGISEAPSLPANLPPTFTDLVLRCLSKDPTQRPTVADLQEEIDPGRRVFNVSSTQPPSAEPDSPRPSPSPSGRRVLVVAMVTFVIVLVAWAGTRLLHNNRTLATLAENPRKTSVAPISRPPPGPPTPADSPSSPAAPAPADSPSPPAAPHPARSPSQPAASAPAESAVVHREIPNASRSALATIHGTIKVAVRVTVDSSGGVARATLEHAGPSQYFARLCTAAAKKWKFSPADHQAAGQWLLKFEFTRSGATVHAAPARP